MLGFSLGSLEGLSWSTRQHVGPYEPEDVDDLPDRQSGVSGAGDQHGVLRQDGVPAAVPAADRGAVHSPVHGAVRGERLRDGAVPGPGAAGRPAAVLLCHAAADDPAADDAAAHDAAAHDAAGGVPGVPAECPGSAAPERQQPGVRPHVPAAQHDGGEPGFSSSVQRSAS